LWQVRRDVVFTGMSAHWRCKTTFVLKLNLKHPITPSLHKDDRVNAIDALSANQKTLSEESGKGLVITISAAILCRLSVAPQTLYQLSPLLPLSSGA
jgi:hypothetical protein